MGKEPQEQQKQRYDQGYRLLAGCIPYQMKKGLSSTSLEQSVEILMITSLNGRGLVLPKGGWETDETLEDAASREAAEEAGVKGHIKEELGVWIFTSKRQNKEWNPKGHCKAYMFALEVTHQLETWPEQENRHRQWFTIGTAINSVRHDWMREALKRFKDHINKTSLPLHNKEIRQGECDSIDYQEPLFDLTVAC